MGDGENKISRPWLVCACVCLGGGSFRGGEGSDLSRRNLKFLIGLEIIDLKPKFYPSIDFFFEYFYFSHYLEAILSNFRFLKKHFSYKMYQLFFY